MVPIRPNCETLERSISSIVAQDFQDWELVAILDRDEGQNETKLRSLVSHSKLSIHHANILELGFPALLNLGISKSAGSLIARHDDDDYSFPTRLSEQAAHLLNNPETGIVTSWAEVVSPEGLSLYDIKPREDSRSICRQLLWRNVIPHSTVMFRKEVCLGISGYRDGLTSCEDYDLWLRMIKKTKFFGIQKALVSYLMNPNGMTKTSIPHGSIKLLRQSRLGAQRELNVSRAVSLLQTINWEGRQWIQSLRK